MSLACIATMVADVADRWLIDTDPHRIEWTWRRIYSSGYSLRPDPTLVAIMSGLEIACWDIVGKDAGKPIHQLLGGRVHDRIRTYTYLYPSTGFREVYTDPDHAAARAVNEAERRVALAEEQSRALTLELANIQKRCSELLEDTGTFSELKLEDPLRPAEGFDPYDRT